MRTPKWERIGIEAWKRKKKWKKIGWKWIKMKRGKIIRDGGRGTKTKRGSSGDRSEPSLPCPNPPHSNLLHWLGVGEWDFFVCWPVSWLFVTVSDLMLRRINHTKAPPLVCTVHTPVPEQWRCARAHVYACKVTMLTNYYKASSTSTWVISLMYFF